MKKWLSQRRKKRVGLALGSGAARGIAHIGVLGVLQREGIPVDVVAGTSAGALAGAFCAQGKDAGILKELVASMDWKKLVSLVDLVLPKTGFIGGKRVRDWLGLVIGGDVRFDDLKTPLACVATDVITGEEVVINRGSVLDAVRASISLPGIFTVVKREGRYLVDGSLVNPVPVRVVREMGADLIIAVNVIPSVTELTQQIAGEGKRALKEPNLFHVMLQSMYIAVYSLVESSLEGADVVIHPRVAHVHYGEFHRGQECIQAGEVVAQEAIPEIKRLLGMR